MGSEASDLDLALGHIEVEFRDQLWDQSLVAVWSRIWGSLRGQLWSQLRSLLMAQLATQCMSPTSLDLLGRGRWDG